MIEQKSKYKKQITDINKIFFVNSDNEIITVFTPYKKIIEEFEKIGIETVDATLEQLIDELSQMLLNEYTRELNENEVYDITEFKETEFYNKINVLLNHVKEVSYNLYDYKENKMPKYIRTFYKYR